VESLSLLSMHPTSKVIKPLPLGEDEALKPLKVMGVINHSWIGVELRAAAAASTAVPKGTTEGAQSNISPARAYFDELQQCVRLTVINILPADPAAAVAAAGGAAPPAVKQMDLEMLKSSTVLQLKQQVLSQLQPSHPSLLLSSFRLRKVVGMEKAGTLLLDESASLSKADLAEDDMRVRAEIGPLPDPQTHVDVLVTLLANVSVGGGGNGSDASAEQPKQALAKLVDRAPFVAEQSWTIKQTKTVLLNHFGLSHRNESAFCLYRGHATYDEHAKPFTAEFMSLSAMQLEQSTWLWLEEGEVPTSGMIQLDIVQVMTNNKTAKNDPSSAVEASPIAADAAAASASAADPLSDANLSAADWRAMQQPLSPYVAVAPPSLEVPAPVSDTPDVSAASSSAAGSSASSSSVSLVLVAPRPTVHLCPLFTLPFSSNDTLLELKQALHSYPDSPLTAAKSAAHLRIRLSNRGDGLGKWINADDKTLKKQTISADKRLLVQVLPEERPERNLSAGALLLKMCTAVPAPEGGVRVGPGALQELLFDDGEYPQLKALQRAMASAVGLAEDENVGVLKWIGAGKEGAAATDGEQKDGAKPATNADGGAATAVEPLSLSSSTPASPPAPGALKGWLVLFPDGPDPAEAAAAAANGAVATGSNAAAGQAKGKGQQKGQQQQNGKGQQKGGGKGNKGQQSGATPTAPIPAWHLKSGAHPLREDDVLLLVRLADFGVATLAELSTLARSWGLAGALPPGYTLVAKDRADELERAAERERARKAAPKRQEIALKIEY
jgi:hypothetical protein